jgi:hypothetical protein
MKGELQKHTLNLFPGDYEKLQDLYPDLGAAVIIRRIVKAYIEQIEKSGDSDAKVDIKL